MTKKTRIAILGLGGVGGYFGGLLAKKYGKSIAFEIVFITRPSTEKIIKEKGLKLITPQSENIIFPSVVTCNPKNLGHIDFLICSVKSYDLEESLKHLTTCINHETVILPLLNGIDAKERIAKVFPAADIWEGCVYIVSRLVEPGVIKETGNIHSLFFGSKTLSNKKLRQLETIFKDANIDCFLSENITQTVWEKFLFISSIASLTSYLNLSIGNILNNRDHRKTLVKLIEELKLIAEIKGIPLSENIIEKTILKMKSLPYETTSSMHSDFQKGGKTEYASLTEYVVKIGSKLNIPTPTYLQVLIGLK